ncbi:uncharacterized protein EI97DRAFT_472076 [Westerdykella ornata]|uniref:Uncharacterized protein n=1 Tax=Westerdykella ornata TaxID=318751 RepID=A0A6A6JXX2_WESOR|nr:uncharacterized protein EI97DRAFT_472076 [Westerdykella ornata]KAF2280933.1 hypothetical protein EI97DRAFT_472076 [Westerdykella ornata]
MGWFTRSRSDSSPSRRYARSSAGSVFSSSSSRHHSSTSRYKRSPREGYIQYLYQKLRHLLRKLWRYCRAHPFKVFFMVIMPLISGGMLHKVAKRFGVDLPGGGAGKRVGGGGGGYYGSEGYGREEGEGGGLEKLASGIGGLASVAKMAQAFM